MGVGLDYHGSKLELAKRVYVPSVQSGFAFRPKRSCPLRLRGQHFFREKIKKGGGFSDLQDMAACFQIRDGHYLLSFIF
jgi:hypothetical protein